MFGFREYRVSGRWGVEIITAMTPKAAAKKYAKAHIDEMPVDIELHTVRAFLFLFVAVTPTSTYNITVTRV